MKVNYVVEETLKYKRTIVLETELSEDELTDLFEECEESNDTAEDIAYALESRGVKVLQYPSTDLSSPDSVETEYWDHTTTGDEGE